MFTDLLYRLATADSARPFLYFQERVISYGEMVRLVDAFAAKLQDSGIETGQNVAMICRNRPAFLIAWFALTELGAVTVPLNTGLVADGLRYSLDQSEAAFLLIEPDLLDEKSAHLACSLDALGLVLLDETVETVASIPAVERGRRNLHPNGINSILYTSGTTGFAKGAVISNICYEQAGLDLAAALQLTADERILLFLPLFHANPQMYGVMSALQTGASLILLPKFSATDFFADAKRYRATGFTFVGSVLSILAKRHAGRQRDHELRWCVGGGAPASVWEDIEQRFGILVHELYGMTESGGWVSANLAGRSRLGSVGQPRRGVEIAVLDERGERLGAGFKGEITARSERAGVFFDGYWKQPQLTRETLRDGWLFTGDRGWVDAEGYLHFDGRLKELIRRGGEMISPVEIELQLLKYPLIRDCGVFAVPDEILGEEIKAAVVAAQPLDVVALRDFLARCLPPHMIPRYLIFVGAIHRTETQKIKRHELASLSGNEIDLRVS